MPVREDLLQPIPGSNPAGTNLRYDPIYDKIKEARREEEDVDQGDWKRARKVADWPLVIKLTGDALTTKSKDLQIAAWLTEGLLKQEGLGGLRAGLGLLQGLLEKFWDHLYPDGCLKAVQSLEELGQQKFEDASPSYSALSQALEEVQHVGRQLLEKKLQTDPDPVDATAGEASGAAGGAASGTGPLAPEPTSVEDAAARIASAARFLRHHNPRNPAPYLMIRGFRWGELRAGGPDLDPRLLAAPPTPVRTHLKGLLLDGKWPELLDAGENIMATPNGRGWLDLQRYELTACEMLGQDYQYVRGAIRGTLVGLLRDFPQLPDLTLMDDTATANVETRTWLQNGGVPSAAGGAAGGGRGAPGGGPPGSRRPVGAPPPPRAVERRRPRHPPKRRERPARGRG